MAYYIESKTRGKLLGKFMGQLYFEDDIKGGGGCLAGTKPMWWDDEDEAKQFHASEKAFRFALDCKVIEDDDPEEEEEPSVRYCSDDEEEQGSTIGHRLISLLWYVMGGLGIIIGMWVYEGCKPISIRIDVPGLSYVLDDVPQLRQEIQELKKQIGR